MGFFALLVWPLTILGLVRGSFYTYKCLKEECDVTKKEEQLQYWVVLMTIICLFSWFSKLFGWIFLGGLIAMIELVLLSMVVLTRLKHGSLYSFIETQFLVFVQPCVKDSLKFTEGFRKQTCNFASIFLTVGHQLIINSLINEVSNEHLESLKRNLNSTIDFVEKEEYKRGKKSETMGNSIPSNVNGQ